EPAHHLANPQCATRYRQIEYLTMPDGMKTALLGGACRKDDLDLKGRSQRDDAAMLFEDLHHDAMRPILLPLRHDTDQGRVLGARWLLLVSSSTTITTRWHRVGHFRIRVHLHRAKPFLLVFRRS